MSSDRYVSSFSEFIFVFRQLVESCSDHSVHGDCEAKETSPLISCRVEETDVFRSPGPPDIEASEEHKAKDFQLIRVPKNKLRKPVRAILA